MTHEFCTNEMEDTLEDEFPFDLPAYSYTLEPVTLDKYRFCKFVKKSHEVVTYYVPGATEEHTFQNAVFKLLKNSVITGGGIWK